MCRCGACALTCMYALPTHCLACPNEQAQSTTCCGGLGDWGWISQRHAQTYSTVGRHAADPCNTATRRRAPQSVRHAAQSGCSSQCYSQMCFRSAASHASESASHPHASESTFSLDACFPVQFSSPASRVSLPSRPPPIASHSASNTCSTRLARQGCASSEVLPCTDDLWWTSHRSAAPVPWVSFTASHTHLASRSLSQPLTLALQVAQDEPLSHGPSGQSPTHACLPSRILLSRTLPPAFPLVPLPCQLALSAFEESLSRVGLSPCQLALSHLRGCLGVAPSKSLHHSHMPFQLPSYACLPTLAQGHRPLAAAPEYPRALALSPSRPVQRACECPLKREEAVARSHL